MISNNEAIENFLNGRRSLAAFQFSKLIKESQTTPASAKHSLHCDDIAFNYAIVNLFTGCPQRASIIFSDLVKRYPRNPRLWLRLSESLLATGRAKMSDYEHIQQLTDSHSKDHLIKTKNKPILIKINPSYCQQQMQQQQSNMQRGTPSNFLTTIKDYLLKALDLIEEYHNISLLTDDVPITNTNNGTLSQKLSYANPYQSISRSALYHLRNKVQLNLAYISLCMGEPAKALTYTTKCLKSSPQGYEKVLASLYHAEACILASRIDEATQFLSMEILNMAKNLSQDQHSLVVGGSKRVVFGEEMQQQIDSGALATVVTYNLSVAFAAKGEFSQAQKILNRCIQPYKPSSMQVIICSLYVQLQQGQLEEAKKIILSNLPQFR